MFNRMRLTQALRHAGRNGPIVAETFMALTAVRWAVFMLLPTWLIENARGGTMATMATYAPTWVWAAAFAVLGLGQFLAAAKDWHRMRTSFALGGAAWWLMVTVFDGLTRFNAATITLATFIIAEAMIYVMLVIAFDGGET